VGQTVYAARCAGCHGASGSGGSAPALIGASAQLSKYGNARALFDFTRANMPFNAPGTLSELEYLQVTAHILLQNNYVTGNTLLSLSGLGGISLVR